ncbi:MAG: phosphatidylglycerophosphatase A, partial [Chitinophagaceae bacterium]
MRLYQLIASCCGIGNIKGGGTIVAILYCLGWYTIPPGPYWTIAQVIFFVLVTVAGIVLSNRLETVWGKDSNKIVIDEVAGMCCTLLFVPQQWQFVLAGLVAFRFFDIVKPLFIAAAEKLPGGWGVMADDVAAGICA